MTSDRLTVVGTGLIGTSVAMAANRVGWSVVGWDADPGVAARAAARGGFEVAPTFGESVAQADLVLICTPIPTIARLVVEALRAAPRAVVSDVGSIKAQVVEEVESLADAADQRRFVGGHPMGGSERSGPDHSSASFVDGIVWVLARASATSLESADRVDAFVRSVGAHPIHMDPRRHDRLVAIVSHLPQVASTVLMGLAAAEEAGEPELLLLAAGGFRDLTRLAASNPSLWSEILLANRQAIIEAIDLYVERLRELRDLVAEERRAEVRAAFAAAKTARLTLAAKPQVRAGVAIVRVGVPDRPGALADLTRALALGEVNIEDLQIVHSPEGGRGAIYLTVAITAVETASRVLGEHGFEPTRLA